MIPQSWGRPGNGNGNGNGNGGRVFNDHRNRDNGRNYNPRNLGRQEEDKDLTKDTVQDLPALKLSREKFLMEVKAAEEDVRSIREQLDKARLSNDPERMEGSSWWHRAKDALGYKERDLRNLQTRAERVQRRIDRLDHPAINHFEREQNKAKLKGVLHVLLDTVRKALVYAEDEDSTVETEEALFEAFDRLDEVLPGWNTTGSKAEREPESVSTY